MAVTAVACLGASTTPCIEKGFVMQKNIVIAGLLVAATWAVAVAQVFDEQQVEPFPVEERPFSFWMDAKLSESQSIFAALAQGDFEEVSESVDVLKTVNKLEGFVRRKSPEYRTQLRAFEFAIDEMKTQAKKENLEGVVLGFHQMTLSCVNCHKQLRDSTDAAAKDGASDGAATSGSQ